MLSIVKTLFESTGLRPEWSLYLTQGLFVLAIAGLSLLANVVVKRVILTAVKKIVEKTKNTWDDIVFKRGVLTRLSHLAPALVVFFLIRIPFEAMPVVVTAVQKIAVVYIIVVTVSVFSSFLSAVSDIYDTYEIAKHRPIRGYIQVARIVGFIIAGVLVITTILNKSPLGILSGIGAMSAVLLLVFKDSIMGFVSGIQLSSNNMVRIGDWIEMPKYGADGDVIEVTLQHVKVRNWDMTITTIPIYSLVSDSFKNWRGMQESGGRRIKRSIFIDMKSIRFLTDEDIEKYKSFSCLKDYVAAKLAEIVVHNKEHGFDLSSAINGRRLTNVGTYRAYLIEYLKRHPKINKNMIMLVRQLAPGPEGLPMEIYVFSNDLGWINYESIQGDIFDHALAVLPEFGLEAYQHTGSLDMGKIAEALREAGGRKIPVRR